MSTRSIKFFCPFSGLSTYNPDNNNSSYNLINNNKRKQSFDTIIINSCLLVSNYNQEELDLSFTGYRCLDTVKLNQLWQLDLLDPKPICIIKAILLVAALF